jgi:uncharacterized membrane protein
MPNADRTGSAYPDGASAKGGVGVGSSVTINKPVDELYRFWRHFENLPRFMRHLESVTAFNNTRSHWVAKTPDDTKIEWDADLIEERPNELIAWCSVPGAEVDSAGEVHFKPAPGNRGTIVRLKLHHDPSAGALGAAIAKLFGQGQENQAVEDLRRFKQLMEAGEIATIEGQPRGERSLLGKVLSPTS